MENHLKQKEMLPWPRSLHEKYLLEGPKRSGVPTDTADTIQLSWTAAVVYQAAKNVGGQSQCGPHGVFQRNDPHASPYVS